VPTKTLSLCGLTLSRLCGIFGSGDRRKNRPQHPIPKYLNIPLISGFFAKTLRKSKK